MLGLGLSVADEIIYRRRLALPYQMKTTVLLLDLEHRVVSDLSGVLLDGYVDGEKVEADKEDKEDPDDLLEKIGIQQSANLTLLDPARSLGLDSRSASDAAIYMDRMIRAYVSVLDPVLGWIDCPIFCGPVTKMERDGIVIQVEAQSKELLALYNSDRNRSYSGRKVDICRNILTDFGEHADYIDFPAEAAKAPKAVEFKRETFGWTKVWRLGQSMGLTPFYDGRGIARMAKASMQPVWIVDGSWITATPQVGYETSDFRTGVRVRSVGDKTIDITERLPSTNPNSAARLGRRGIPRTLIEFIFNNEIRSVSEARKVGSTSLADSGATVEPVSLECHPIWPLEIGDAITVDTDDYYGVIRVDSWRKPLTCDGQMQIGYSTTIVSPSAAQIRRP